jgi:hypothetical protein
MLNKKANMKKIFIYVFGTLVLLVYTDCDTTDPYSDLMKLEYEVTGGIAGINYKTTVSDQGKAAFTHYNKNRKYVISTSLMERQLDSLNKVLLENDIFDLADSYKPPQPVMDGINISIKYNNGNASKNIYVEGGADIPKELENIIQKLFEITIYIQSNPGYGTLTTIWDQTDNIKKWLFLETKLQVKAFNYNELSNADSIMNYFDEIKTNYGYDILYWDVDSLYDIYDGGRDYGYFNVYAAYPVNYWHDEFNYDLSTVQNKGIVLSADEWEGREIYFNKTYVYVMDKLEDNGKAIRVKLIPGKPDEN